MCHCFRALCVGGLLSGMLTAVVSAESEQDAPKQAVAKKTAARQSTPQMDVLSIVNQKRAQRGLYPFNFDPRLTATAEFKSQNRARRRCTGHDGSSLNGARTEGVGYAHGQSHLPMRFQACHLYSKSYRNAGAAIAYDNSGRAYYTLLLR